MSLLGIILGSHNRFLISINHRIAKSIYVTFDHFPAIDLEIQPILHSDD